MEVEALRLEVDPAPSGDGHFVRARRERLEDRLAVLQGRERDAADFRNGFRIRASSKVGKSPVVMVSSAFATCPGPTTTWIGPLRLAASSRIESWNSARSGLHPRGSPARPRGGPAWPPGSRSPTVRHRGCRWPGPAPRSRPRCARAEALRRVVLRRRRRCAETGRGLEPLRRDARFDRILCDLIVPLGEGWDELLRWPAPSLARSATAGRLRDGGAFTAQATSS